VLFLMGLLRLLQPRTVVLSVYFLRGDQGAFTVAPVTKTVAQQDKAALLATALGAMLEGPSESDRVHGLTSAIPPGTRLNGVQIQGDTVRADFSRQLESGGGSVSMLGRFWQIVYTATQFPEAARVKIFIDGQDRTALGGEGVLIDHPIGRPLTPPRF
jgi:spore germination protein GerM